MTPPNSTEETAPLWIAILLVAILAVTMFAAGYVLGIRSSADTMGDVQAPSIGNFRFEADSGTIRRDPN